MLKKILLAILMLLVISTSVFADVIHLKNGKKVAGEILQESKYSIKVQVKGIPYTYYRNEIDKIERGKPAAQVAPVEEKPVRQSLALISETKKNLALRFLEANGARESMNRIFSQILSEAPEESREELKKLLIPDEVILKLVPIYDSYYSEQELKDLILFYKSPAGIKQLKVTPKIMEETMTEIAEYFNEKVSADAKNE